MVVIEAIPEYLENLRINLQHYLRLPYPNILYVSKGVDSICSRKRLQIGQFAAYSKFARHGVDDGLRESDYIREIEIETDTIDQILKQNCIHLVNHIEMTISGMELEALKGMSRTLLMSGLRIKIRSLHMRDGRLLCLQVEDILKRSGIKTVLGRKHVKFKGRDVYACRF